MKGIPDQAGVIKMLKEAIALVRQHQAELPQDEGEPDHPKRDCPWKCKAGNAKCLCMPVSVQQRGYLLPDGRPIFGEGSPHDIGEYLQAVCSEISVVEEDALRDKISRELRYSLNASSYDAKAITGQVIGIVRPYLRTPEPVSVEEAAHTDMLAAELIALANEAEGHAAMCKSGELMNACAKANKAWAAHVEKRRSKSVTD